MSNEKDGVYCKVCGGIIPQDTTVGSIEVNGKPTGINQLEWILDEVSAMHLQSDGDLKKELISRAKVLNYIPTKITEQYADALLRVYKERLSKKE
ncbi:MAG: NAC family transcription factor [Methanospirillum sp.]|uniref:NAC family transcription factor n=1 Tax=Methanospirillum sp. TaxID=45200 RepID=UPI00236B4BB0|nr:NAC family transcription factor [Methanospirillum sp.]MDD1728644.1 NAC family transcription factor [Methanospirillum sp.]